MNIIEFFKNKGYSTKCALYLCVNSTKSNNLIKYCNTNHSLRIIKNIHNVLKKKELTKEEKETQINLLLIES